MTAEAYPLAWPPGVPRTPSHQRTRARFGSQGQAAGFAFSQRKAITLAAARDRLLAELDRLGATSAVLSTNLELRLDGLPRSGQRAPDDPGVAVYFHIDGVPHCLPCDRWDRVEDNVAAVAKHIEATRGQLRWGVGDVRAAFAGFRALPAKGETSTAVGAWWQVLQVAADAPLEVAKAAYRALAGKHHPDAGGDAGAMATINRAWEQAQEARR
jgi:hypothetical protein